MTVYRKGERGLVEELRELRTHLDGLERRNAELMQIQEMLQESVNQIKTIFDNTLVGLYSTTPDGQVLMANSALLKMLGYSSFDQLAQRNLEQGAYEPQYLRSAFKERIESDGKIVGLESAWKKSDGTTLYVRESAQSVRDESGNILYYQGTVEDITERKQAEEALRSAHDELDTRVQQRTAELQRTNEALHQSESRYRTVVENAGEGIVVVQDRTLRFVNPRIQEITGYSEKELTSRPLAEFIHQDDLKDVMEVHTRRLQGQKVPLTNEFRIVDKQGNTKWLENSGVVIEWNGRAATLNFLRDITERKKAQEALRQSENRYRTVVEHAGEGIVVIQDGIIRFVNPRAADITGYLEEELTSRPFTEFVHPDDQQRAMEFHTRRLAGQEVPSIYELRIVDKQGTTKWLESSGVRIEWNGRAATLNFLRDITERKRAEDALAASETKYRSLFDNSIEGIGLSKGNRVISANRALLDIFGYDSIEEFARIPLLDHVAPESRAAILELIQKAEKGVAESSSRFECTILRKDGQRRVLEISRTTILINGERFSQSIFRDITERKGAENALRESEEKFRSLADQSPNMIFINKKGRVVYANRKCEEIMGYTREEFYSPDFDFLTLFAPESMDAIKGYFARHLRGQEVGSYDSCLISRTGQRIEAINTCKLIQYEGETAILGIVTDITERKQAQQRLVDDREQLKSLASELSLTEERERRRLATVLHDHIGQSLVISKIKLDRLCKSSISNELNKSLEDISKYLGQIIDDTRALTFDLSYPILYELGFEAAVAEWLTDQIQEKHGIETEFVDDGRQKPLDDDIRVLLFRNVRELLINVVKHAQANRVMVAIHKVDKHIEVSVEDDGVGFDPVEIASMAAKRAEFGLFSIRERLEQLGGRIEIHSEPGRGSRITMIAPLKYENSKDEI